MENFDDATSGSPLPGFLPGGEVSCFVPLCHKLRQGLGRHYRMMKQAIWVVGAIVTVVGASALIFLVGLPPPKPTGAGPTAARPTEARPTVAEPTPESVVDLRARAEPERPTPAPDQPKRELDLSAGSPLARNLNAPSGNVQQDLELLYRIMHQFRAAVRGNVQKVWGTNQELTGLLTGENPTILAFIPRGHPAVSAGGELIDRWGTPYFFHKDSSDRTVIRSAGPDRTMWTNDDVQYPRSSEEDRAAAGLP